MSVLVLTLLYAVGLGAGWLIGAIGVGGVLLVPALVVIGGMDVSAATPVASLSFLFTGVVGTVAYARTGRLKTDAIVWLTIGAVPGAIAGAATNVALPSRVVTIAIAIVLTAATVRTLHRPEEGGGEPDRDMSRVLYVTIGGLVGFASALTGTGGPVLLIPVIAGIAYEVLKLAANHRWMSVASRPGIWLQRLTTREPTDDQVEVAVASLLAALDTADRTDVEQRGPIAPGALGYVISA